MGIPWIKQPISQQDKPSPKGKDSGHVVMASSFADPADYRAWQKCKAEGNSDHQCFAIGDNCIGYWGDFTGEGSPAYVALPPEVMIETWGSIANAKHKHITVSYEGRSVDAQVGDTMPHIANIKNGARLDMNPATCAGLGLIPPVMAQVSWQKS